MCRQERGGSDGGRMLTLTGERERERGHESASEAQQQQPLMVTAVGTMSERGCLPAAASASGAYARAWLAARLPLHQASQCGCWQAAEASGCSCPPALAAGACCWMLAAAAMSCRESQAAAKPSQSATANAETRPQAGATMRQWEGAAMSCGVATTAAAASVAAPKARSAVHAPPPRARGVAEPSWSATS